MSSKSTIKTLKLDAKIEFVWEIGYTYEKQADFWTACFDDLSCRRQTRRSVAS